MSKTQEKARIWLKTTDRIVTELDTDLQKLQESAGNLARSYGQAVTIIHELLKDLAKEMTTLEAELEAVRQIMDQPWDDSHDRGRDEAFKRLAKIRNALNLNSDPVTEDTPSAEALAGESDGEQANDSQS